MKFCMCHRWSLLLLAIFACSSAWSQRRGQASSTVDADSARATLAEEQAWRLREVDWDSSAMYARLAISLGRRCGALRTTAYALNDLAGYYDAMGEPDSALACLQESMQLRRALGNPSDIASGHNLLGSHYTRQGHYQQALGEFKLGLTALSAHATPALQAMLCDNLSQALRGLGDYTHAIQSLELALRLNQLLGDDLAIAKSEHNIGLLLHETHRPEAAWEYYARAAMRYSANGNITGLADILANEAMIWNDRGRQDSALQCLDRCRMLLEKVGDAQRLHDCYHNTALIYKDLGDKKAAEKLYELDWEFCARHGLLERQRVTAVNLGLLLLESGQHVAALEWANRAEQAGSLTAELRLSLYDIRSRAYSGLQQYESGLEWQGRHRRLQDSLVHLNQDVQNLTDKYLAERARSEKALQQAAINAALLAQSQAENRLQVIAIVASAMIMALLVTVLLVNRRRQKHRLHVKQAELDMAKAREIHQQRSLEIQTLMQEAEVNALRVTMTAQERERQRIGRNLHDRVGSKLSLAQMLVQNLSAHLQPIPPKVAAQLERAVTVLDESCDEVREVARNMTSSDLAAYGFQMALQRFCEQVESSSNRLKAKVTITGLPIQLEPATEQELYSVVRTLVENVVKHAVASTLLLTLSYSENGLSLEVTDDGVGFAPMSMASANGIGLKNAQLRTEALHGTMTIRSAPGAGCSIIIHIPIPPYGN